MVFDIQNVGACFDTFELIVKTLEHKEGNPA